MKKVLLILALFISTASSAFAQSASPRPTNTAATENLIQQIDELKDKVASRVAELNLVEKRGIIGVVTESSDTQVTVEDLNGDVRFIDVDELTKFNSDEDSFGISDIEKGMQLGILGLYNKESRRLLARFVSVLEMPKMFIGVVSGTNSDDFTITLVTTDNKELTADVENVTRTFEYDEDGTLVRSGFTNIEVSQNIILVGFPDATEKSRISASRIILFPDVPKNPKINLKTPAPTVSPSASGKTSPTP